jgi:chromosome segregation ATPase
VKLPEPPVPPGAAAVRAVLERRQEIQHVAERTAALESERASLVELRERLKVDERSRLAALASVRRECDELEQLLAEDVRRAEAVQAEIRGVDAENLLLESAVRALAERAESAELDVRAAMSRLTNREDQRTAAEAALASARGALARMQHRLRYGLGAEIADPPAGGPASTRRRS